MRPPPPHHLSVLQMRGQACGWPGAPSPSSREGRTTPLHARHCRAGERAKSGARGALSSQPPPRPSPLPGPAFPPPSPSPVPAPSSAAAAAASAPTGSARLSFHSLRLPQPISARLLPWPRSRLPPSCAPPSTGSRDGDRSCAAHPHPQTRILPTSPIARELRTGERQISRGSSPWQRLQQKQPVLETKSGRGPMWGLESVGGGCGS